MTSYLFQRGETIALALDAVTGDPQSIAGISAQLKAIPPGRTSVPPGEPVAAEFVISTRPAEGETPAGWTLVIAAATSAGLTPGHYLADARLDVAGGVIVTEPVSIRIRQSVSA